MVTRDGNTITVSFYVEWDEVLLKMSQVLDTCEPPMKRDAFTDDEIDEIMEGIRERIEKADNESDDVNVDEIIEEFCLEYLVDDEKCYIAKED